MKPDIGCDVDSLIYVKYTGCLTGPANLIPAPGRSRADAVFSLTLIVMLYCDRTISSQRHSNISNKYYTITKDVIKPRFVCRILISGRAPKW